MEAPKLRATSDEREASTGVRDVLQWAKNGAVGGGIATLVMSAYRLPVADSLPPTAEFWAEYVSGGEPDDHPVAALLLHLVYGAGGGAAFAVLFERFRDDARSDSKLEAGGVVLGALYGLVLSAVGERVMLGWLLDTDLDATESLVFHVSHLVYGLSLGSWLAAEATPDGAGGD